ncbi:MAG: hypothetical protein COZ57_37690, partial [Armatimonadetes bacterium CG_4_8_14_3_um_filter_66_20]
TVAAGASRWFVPRPGGRGYGSSTRWRAQPRSANKEAAVKALSSSTRWRAQPRNLRVLSVLCGE